MIGDDIIQVGDLREGRGTHRVLVRIRRLGDGKAQCTLERSGTPKTIAMATLRKAYRLVRRGCEGCGRDRFDCQCSNEDDHV